MHSVGVVRKQSHGALNLLGKPLNYANLPPKSGTVLKVRTCFLTISVAELDLIFQQSSKEVF